MELGYKLLRYNESENKLYSLLMGDLEYPLRTIVRPEYGPLTVFKRLDVAQLVQQNLLWIRTQIFKCVYEESDITQVWCQGMGIARIDFAYLTHVNNYTSAALADALYLLEEV